MLVVLSAAPMAAAPALAGDAAITVDGDWNPTAASGQTAETLPTVNVEGERAPSNTMQAPTGFGGRLPQPVEDTPQTIKVINQETIQQQNITTLDQALRMVPGITSDVGEGGGGMNGDQFRIRGFQAKNDIYSDGLKDFGVYVRDAFNTESVEVLVGSSSSTTGRGAEGGAINMTSKTPVLDDFITLNGSLGLGPSLRGTADINQKIGDTTAVRLNLLYTEWDIVDRDVPTQSRFGFAPSIAFGLGTDTTLSIAYLHQQDHRVPDYGIPTFAKGVTFTSPTTGVASPLNGPAPVDHANWYGSTADRDDTTADIVTIRLSHKVNDKLEINNDSRYGHYTRDFMTTVPACSGGPTSGVVSPGSCLWNLYDNDPSTIPVITFGGGNPYYQAENWGVQNVTTAILDYDIGGFKNQFVAGVDLAYEESERQNYTGQVRPGGISLLDPDSYDVDLSGLRVSRFVDGNAFNLGLYASEQFWLTKQISVLGGVRWDYYDADLTDTSFGAPPAAPLPNTIHTNLTFWSPKASLIWQPTESQTYYVSWSKSSTPATAANLANEVTPGNGLRTNNDPTETETFEVGAKVGFFEDRLGLSLALFQIERQNVRQEGNDGVEFVAADQIKNEGVELGVTGKITDELTVQLAYAYIDSEIKDSSSTNPDTIGSVGVAVPEHSASLWTTYVPVESVTLGLGATYKDEMELNNAGTLTIPEYLSIDAMASYEVAPGARVQVNGYNLFDREDNYDQVRSGRVVPSAGRTVVFTTSVTF